MSEEELYAIGYGKFMKVKSCYNIAIYLNLAIKKYFCSVFYSNSYRRFFPTLLNRLTCRNPC